ncbi:MULTISPECIES: DUF445 domain-containing protein [Neisseria]|uniref:DUF445 domain-containing protein n=1 Tax=Neisseria musculi TaxID=1815583 RepID=A0A7H1MC08_9NEIS|nr:MULTISPECIES: DUF445 domain-containing protein [Neisseria]MBF0803623.1 DUF445 domain-containing protein [Neisseria sp. 19428wB4_WF04]QNT59173.1 hypothetical protein H7A79_2423 [Neisseria musculi]TFU43704.1 DUF445 domain-containing protein [Neisseria sp. WF04]
MHTLSAQARANRAEVRLKKSRRLAAGLLLLACALFAVSAAYAVQYPALGYVKAFAEAAMVGALADWFAVTALFRRPLGLPVPHTAILPRNQHRIADELGRFIENNFLEGRPIALRIYRAAPSKKLLAWLAEPQTRAQWLPWLAAQLPALFKAAKPGQAARFFSMLAGQYSGESIGKTLSDGLKALKAQGWHDVLFTALLKQTRRRLQDPETRQQLEHNLHAWAAKIESGAPSTWEKLKASLKGTLADKVDGWVSEKALDWADGCLAAALADPDHPIRRSFNEQYDRLADALSRSRLWHKRLEQGKAQLARSPAVREMLENGWRSLQAWTENDMHQPDSVWLAQLNKLLDHMLAQAQRHPQFMRRADVRISLMVRDFVMHYKSRAAVFVADKVKSWDSAQMVEKLELSIGRDLQFIRINGTLVGGLVGLAIYCVSQWLF